MTEPQNPDDQPLGAAAGANSQDLEHDARPETRVNNAGVKVAPPDKDEPEKDPEEPPPENAEQGNATEIERKFGEALVRLPPG